MNASAPDPAAAAEANQVAARRAGEDAGDPGPGGKGGVAPEERLLSLDAYRGAIMLLMASSGLGLAEIARNHFPGDPVWGFIGKQTDHARWAGCTLWDIIQPAFMFMWQVMGSSVRETLKTHFGRHIFDILGTAYSPILERLFVLLVFWLILLWMHRKKIFLRI
jgi:predicted acyltransferase